MRAQRGRNSATAIPGVLPWRSWQRAPGWKQDRQGVPKVSPDPEQGPSLSLCGQGLPLPVSILHTGEAGSPVPREVRSQPPLVGDDLIDSGKNFPQSVGRPPLWGAPRSLPSPHSAGTQASDHWVPTPQGACFRLSQRGGPRAASVRGELT